MGRHEADRPELSHRLGTKIDQALEKTPFKRSAPNLVGKRVWVANGAADPYSPADRVEALVAELQELGAEVHYSLHPGGHTISHEQVKAIAEQLVG